MPNTMRLLTDMTKSERESFTKERSEVLRSQHSRKKQEVLHCMSKVEEDGGVKEVEEDIIIAPAHSIDGGSMNSISKKILPLVTAAASPQYHGVDIMKTTNELVRPTEKQRREEGSTIVSQHLKGATGAASRLLETPPLVSRIHSLPPEHWPPIRLSQHIRSHRAEAESTVMDDSTTAQASSRVCTDVTVTDPFERADKGINRSIRRHEERKRRLDVELEGEPRHHFKQSRRQ